MSLFRDSHKPAALVLSEFDIEMFALYLQFSSDNYIIHDFGRGGYH